MIVKGFEALLIEALIAAKAYGVEETVIQSLNDLFPGSDWSQHAHYMITRALQHGSRRAEEMREASIALSAVMVDPIMSQSTVRRQAMAATHAPMSSDPSLSNILTALIASNSNSSEAAQ